MKKIILIDGMSCGHCKARVEQVLNEITGVHAKVDLKKKTATIEVATDIKDEVIKEVIANAGYEVISVTEKKGLFSR